MNLKKWHKAVCERDMYVCQVCGKDFSYPMYFNGDKNQYVCGHHVSSQGSSPAERFNVDNGVCVCSPCHHDIHTGKAVLESHYLDNSSQ